MMFRESVPVPDGTTGISTVRSGLAAICARSKAST